MIKNYWLASDMADTKFQHNANMVRDDKKDYW